MITPNQSHPPSSAAQIATALGISPRAIRCRLEGVAPTGEARIRGQVTDTWTFDALPSALREELNRIAKKRGFRSAHDLLHKPPVEWQPEIPLSDVAASHVEKAELLRRAFERTLTARLHALSLSEEEFVRAGVADYCRELEMQRGRKEVSISDRQWRRIFDRIVERDGGAENYSRLELYLPENVGRRAQHATPEAPGEFRALSEYVLEFRNPLSPSPEEQAAFWHRVCEVFFALVDAGKVEAKMRRRLLKFLWRSVPNAADWLATSPNALRVNLGRKLDRYESNSGKIDVFMDGRRAKLGEARAENYPQEEVDAIAAHAAFNCGGRIAQSVRECVENGTVSHPRIVSTYQRDIHSKSYVKRSLKNRLTDVAVMADMTLGKRADSRIKPPLALEYDGIYSMDCIVADDFTFNVYFSIPDGEGWYTLTRGQVILVCDFRTLRVLGWALRPEKQYDAVTILRTFRDVFKDFGLPKFVLREGGIWRRARMINALAKPPAFSPAEFELRMSALGGGHAVRFGDEETVIRGLAEVRIEFKEAYAARVKPVERVGGLLQDLMDGEPGYCGRNEKIDKPEATRKAMLAVEGKRSTPAEAGFYSFEQWDARLREIIEKWNNTAHDKRARRIPGLTPVEAFEETYWPEDRPTRLDASCEWLLAAERIENVHVAPNGVALYGGKHRYCDSQTAARVGQKLIAFFDPLSPERCTFTDVNMKNHFTVARLPGRNALHPDDRTEAGMSLINSHHGALKTRFHVLKAKRQLPFRINVVDAKTARIGAHMQEEKQQAERTRVAVASRESKVRRRASELGLPVSTLDTTSAEGDEFTRMMVEASRENQREQEDKQ